MLQTSSKGEQTLFVTYVPYVDGWTQPHSQPIEFYVADNGAVPGICNLCGGSVTNKELHLAMEINVGVKGAGTYCGGPVGPNCIETVLQEHKTTFMAGNKVRFVHDIENGGLSTKLIPSEDKPIKAVINPCLFEDRSHNEEKENVIKLPDSFLGNPEINKSHKIEGLPGAELKVIPNPFNSSVMIAYTVISGNNNSQVAIRLYGITGNLISTIFEGVASDGNYSVCFDTNKLSPGLYYFELSIDNRRITKKAGRF
jgi:hypothetical protein